MSKTKTKQLRRVEIGQPCYVREVTDHWVGVLESIDGPHTVTISRAAWVADSGRLHVFLRDGRAEGMEIEAVPDDMAVSCQWVTLMPWPHPLLRETV